MSNLIDRQAAIDDLHGKDPSQVWDTADVEVWVNDLPSAQPEPYEDAARLWTPANEGLPKKKGWYLVTYDGEIHGDDGKRFTSIEYWTGKKWSEMTVYAWAPLPKPYEEEKKK